MCIAVPAKVIKINGNRAKAEYFGNIIEIEIGIVKPQIGDYCLIHAGCAIEVIDKDKADEINSLLKDLEDAFNEND